MDFELNNVMFLKIVSSSTPVGPSEQSVEDFHLHELEIKTYLEQVTYCKTCKVDLNAFTVSDCG